MSHAFRLMSMGKEIADGKGIILDRTGIDRDFLMDVRNRKYGYSELMKKMTDFNEKMNESIKNMKIKEGINPEIVNSLLLDIRKQWRKNI